MPYSTFLVGVNSHLSESQIMRNCHVSGKRYWSPWNTCPCTRDSEQAWPVEAHGKKIKGGWGERGIRRTDTCDTFVRIIELVNHKSQPFPRSTASTEEKKRKKNKRRREKKGKKGRKMHPPQQNMSLFWSNLDFFRLFLNLKMIPFCHSEAMRVNSTRAAVETRLSFKFDLIRSL